jgi:hypothetical protein
VSLRSAVCGYIEITLSETAIEDQHLVRWMLRIEQPLVGMELECPRVPRQVDVSQALHTVDHVCRGELRAAVTRVHSQHDVGGSIAEEGCETVLVCPSPMPGEADKGKRDIRYAYPDFCCSQQREIPAQTPNPRSLLTGGLPAQPYPTEPKTPTQSSPLASGFSSIQPGS